MDFLGHFLGQVRIVGQAMEKPMESAYNAYSASGESSCFSPYLAPYNAPMTRP